MGNEIKKYFLAAMSSSRSDVVTQFVSSLVMKEFFFSLRSYKGISRKSNGCFNEVSRMFHASFMDRRFQGCFKKVSRVLRGCFEGVSRVFQRSSKEDSRKFWSCLDEVSMVFLQSFKWVAKSFWC